MKTTSQTPHKALKSRSILRMRADATNYADAAARILGWASSGESRYVCVANVHMTMESYDSQKFCDVVNGADLVTPDGMPLVWALRAFGIPEATRVYGPSLTEYLLKRAEDESVAVGFYGGSPEAIERLRKYCSQQFPGLSVAYAYSPPFRPLTATEDEAVVEEINLSGARILFVGLGCPKQEQWMAAHKGAVNATMVGVGAAFDFLTGQKLQAPRWMQPLALEWLFRFATEPRRLWRRYVIHNPRFVVLLARQLLKTGS